jgi:sodium transport system permease protein
MNPAWIIFCKELKDTLRDRRTIITMVLIPLLLFPVLMTIVTKVTSSQTKKAQEKTIKVGLIAQNNAAAFRDILLNRDDMEIHEDTAIEDIESMIKEDKLDAVIRIDAQFDQQVADQKSGDIHLHFKSSKDLNVTRRRLTPLINDYEEQLVTDRFDRLYLDRNIGDAIKTHRHDVASDQEKFGKAVGGFLPYMFIIFCFMGCMYPAIDLGAGEKERGTLETLLASPASRFQILLGKFGVVALAGLTSTCLTFIGIFVAVSQHREIVEKLTDVIGSLLAPANIAISISLLLPLTIFFAAALLAISIFAKSFKEAQSLMTPLNLFIILPVFVGLLPGIELTSLTALIPVLNVSLATKEVLAGTITMPLLLEVYASLILLAGLSLFFCAKWFDRESVIFRES